VIIDRLAGVGIAFLDSHQQVGIDNALGMFQRIWFPGDGSLAGKIKFNDTPRGRLASGMVQRGEIGGVSCGYKVNSWLIEDENGDEVDPNDNMHRWDDTGMVFTAIEWELLEVSATLVSADASASFRSLTTGTNNADVKARMLVRERSAMRLRMVKAQAALYRRWH
jgi:phage head maturation protease